MNLNKAARSGRFIGRNEMIYYLSGKKLPKWKAVKAKCYECMSGYPDGKMDCRIPDCPLYPFMPYRAQDQNG